MMESYLDAAVERVAIGEVGKSGASIERVRMPDGRRLVVKRVSPDSDLFMRVLGRRTYPELDLWQRGILDEIPLPATHSVVDGWVDGDLTVLVMRDLGDRVLTWDDRLSRPDCQRVLGAAATVHRTFEGRAPWGLTPLGDLLSLFAPQRVAPQAEGSELARTCLYGWELFAERVEQRVSEPVLALLAEPTPLVAALERCPCTLIHGDLATVNVALETNRVTLLDWAMPARAPGAVDVARFIAGCSSVVDASREEILADYRDAAGPSYDGNAMRLAMLSGLVWLGWNKAFDAAEHPDPALRLREQADLDWWVREADLTLRSGLL
ncbi:MAG: hypothetical protein ACRDO2_08070 [Nocardioidaceae bacterium]